MRKVKWGEKKSLRRHQRVDDFVDLVADGVEDEGIGDVAFVVVVGFEVLKVVFDGLQFLVDSDVGLKDDVIEATDDVVQVAVDFSDVDLEVGGVVEVVDGFHQARQFKDKMLKKE